LADRIYTYNEKLLCVEREIKMRERVYKRRVTMGTMSKHQAEFEINLMKAIAEDIRPCAEEERLI